MRIARWSLAAILVGVSLLLCVDGLTFGLSVPDPARGRVGGCYTVLDDIMGSRSPVYQLRVVEVLSPAVSACVGCFLLRHRTTERRRLT